MIDSLEIKNYRNLDGLKVKLFGKINLIAGKNNTGKTNFLHALELLVSDFDLEALKKQLEKKREFDDRKYRNDEDSEVKNIFIFRNLYPYQANIDFTNPLIFKSKSKTISAKIIKIKRIEDENSIRYITGESLLFDEEINSENGLEISKNNERLKLLPFSRKIFRSVYVGSSLKEQFSSTNYQFIETDSIEKDLNSNLWDRIALSNKEEYLIDALKIIDTSIERLTFVGDNVRERYAIVKKAGSDRVYPLKSMGDGINRILTIILALLNVENGYLFIDEFENGLHYTVQEDLWKIIFHLANQLNIQIFATTHSNDCINAFQKVLNAHQNNVTGQYIRLENKNNEIREVSYSDDEIKYASENNIEVR
jgi:AAA15 family ATPase/GTPase